MSESESGVLVYEPLDEDRARGRGVAAFQSVPVDTARIVLVARGRPPIMLCDDHLAHMDATEWMGKTRVFLRKQGRVPFDERDPPPSAEPPSGPQRAGPEPDAAGWRETERVTPAPPRARSRRSRGALRRAGPSPWPRRRIGPPFCFQGACRRRAARSLEDRWGGGRRASGERRARPPM